MNQEFEQDGQNKLNRTDIAKFLDQVNQIYRNSHSAKWLDEWKQYIQMDGLQNIGKSRSSLPKINQKQHRIKIAEKIVQLSLEHPDWGAKHVSGELKSLNLNISPSTVYHILQKYQISTKDRRFLKLSGNFDFRGLSWKQFNILEKLKPYYQMFSERGKYPGELLAQDTFFIGYFQNSELNLQIVIDSYSNYAFGIFHLGKRPAEAALMIQNEVLPFFGQLQIPVSTILTDNSPMYSGNQTHYYELYLKLNDIQHRRIQPKKMQNSFIRQFKQIFKRDFLNKTNITNIFQDTDKIAVLQDQFRKWLIDYNHQRPTTDFSSPCRPPFTMIMDYYNIQKIYQKSK